jgi:hypothetical protein
MDAPINSKRTIEIIERMQLAKIGKYKNDQILNPEELKYYSNLTRIYKNSSVTSRSKIYHTKLSLEDEKPPCKECGKDSLYYCNMNDQYFCNIHVVGHDKNEI